jgi:hypothetical protein
MADPGDRAVYAIQDRAEQRVRDAEAAAAKAHEEGDRLRNAGRNGSAIEKYAERDLDIWAAFEADKAEQEAARRRSEEQAAARQREREQNQRGSFGGDHDRPGHAPERDRPDRSGGRGGIDVRGGPVTFER